jgi:peptidoglycan/LPS O-acetylase OafA/YrhL
MRNTETFVEIASSRNNNFDFLRFALAVAVILAHCYPPGAGISIPLTHRQWPIGSHAVEGFFAISGCLITASWERSRGLGSFAWKRFLRIFPGWAVSLLVCVLVIGPLAGADLHTYFTNPRTWRFFQPLLLAPPIGLPGVFQHLAWKDTVNGPTWTIRFEVLCYCLVALLGLTRILANRWAVLGLFTASVAAYTVLYFTAGDSLAWQIPWIGDSAHLPRLAAFYLSGAAFYSFRHLIPRNRPLAAVMGLAAATLFHWQSVVLPICGTYLLFYIATSRSLKLYHFGKRGDFSYGMYLYGFPVQQMIVYHFGYPSVPILFLSATAIALLVSMASWRFVEAPAMTLARSRRAAAASEGKAVDEPISEAGTSAKLAVISDGKRGS